MYNLLSIWWNRLISLRLRNQWQFPKYWKKKKIPNGYRASLCRYHQSLQIGYVANNGG